MNPSDENEEGKGEPPLVAMARFSGYGLTLAMATAAFLFLGWWADGKLGTTPWLTLFGALVGAAGGFYHILQHLVFFPMEEERRKRSGEADPGREEDRR
jgi:F0F1-type ATP synthase assembly protein I